MTGAPEGIVEVARMALDRHAWREAYEALRQADEAGALTAASLELLASAAYWTAHPDETLEALERAYGAYLQEGDQASAAMMAFRVAEQHGMRMAMPQFQGWAAKAQRMAQENPEWPVNGWLEWTRGLLAWFAADFRTAIEHYERSLEFAARSGDRDLHGMSLHDMGHALCLAGRVAEGMALMDEAMAAVIGGELNPEAAGYVYCGMIGACSKLGDYRRSAEWTETTMRWCERNSVPAFPGVCRIHKAELMRLHGNLSKAEEEAQLACEELPRFNFLSGMGPANYEIGEVRRRLGDDRGAEEAYARSREFGFSPQPGQSLLRLAQGKVDSAAAGIRQALAESGVNHCLQVRLLSAQIEVALAAGDLDGAESAVTDLDQLVGEYEAASLHAIADGARGAVRLARGDPAAALPDLRLAQQAWDQLQAPYEGSGLRLLLAETYRALGDEDEALAEARVARDTFERLGAGPAAERAASLVGELSPSNRALERVGRAFMFTDIVKSTDLVGAIGDEAWEDLLRWHDQILRSLFASHGGDVAHHTGDGFFVAFEDARSALTCAISVQRALAEQRRTQGFALQVRIGVHAGEATRRGQDYSGGEVHKAARIAALAGGGEILASVETVNIAGSGFVQSEPREVTLKGVAEAVRITAIAWR